MATKIAYKPKIAKPPIKTKHNKRHRLDAKVLLWNVYGFSQKQQQKKQKEKTKMEIKYGIQLVIMMALQC